MVILNFKHCNDCIKAGVSCFPSFTIKGNIPVKDTFCDKAYERAIKVSNSEIKRIYMKDIQSR